MPTYPMTLRTANAIVAEFGREFGAAIADETICSRVISERYGMSKNRVQRIRRTLHGNIRPRLKLDIADPRTLEVLKRRITHAEVAELLNVSFSTVIFWRRRLRIKTKFIKELRYNDGTIALLKSTLPRRDVARALGISEDTVKRHRQMINGTRPYRLYSDLSDEQRAIIAEPISAREAATRTGLGEHRVNTERLRVKNPPPPDGWPQDRTWYEDKTPREIAEAVGCSRGLVYFIVHTRSLRVKATQCQGE